MELEGLHHITMVTGDAQRTVDFHAGVLGLRLVKQTVNFDAPEAYHLYFGDERGSPGSILTWFEFAGAPAGRAGAGMVHRIDLAVPGAAALEFWTTRLTEHGHPPRPNADGGLDLADPDGLALRLVAATPGAVPLRAAHPGIPPAHAITGVAGARAFARTRIAPPLLTETLGFTPAGDELRMGATFRYGLDPAPGAPGRLGAGTVHHIAWASPDEDHLAWQARLREAGAQVTDVRDRDYFRSIYFREPTGVLFEIATLSPGFTVDEPLEHLGESLQLPRMHEALRPRLEQLLTPLVNPRAAARPAG